MELTNHLTLKGRVKIILRDVTTGREDIQEVNNLIVTVGKNSIADGLRGTTGKGAITYCAVGTGTGTPVVADTKLNAELARKLVSATDLSGANVIFTTFFNQDEANGTLREIGLFGDAASLTADSGTLFARTLINRTKNNNNTLTLAWTLTVQ